MHTKSEKNRICFMSNGTKTDFFIEIAKRLDPETTRVSWIVVTESYRAKLVEQFGEDNVLFLSLKTPHSKPALDIKINDLIFADRRLKFIMPQAKRYLEAIQGPVFEFLKPEVPTLIVGELTYAHEVLIFRIIKKHLKHCVWGSPFLTRVPEGKFAFFSDDAFSREVFSGSITPPTAMDKDEIDYKEMNERHIEKQSSAGFWAKKIWSFITKAGYDPDDPSWLSSPRRERLSRNVRTLLNKRSYAKIDKVGLNAIDACEGKSVIFPLHLQPELNIDTCGRYWENQTETILKVWRQLGPNDQLFIKEHPVAIGNRGAAWYNNVLRHPNLFLLDHKISPVDILKRIDYVFTISGTMGLEAALAGKNVFCLAPTTYDRIETVVTPTIFDFRAADNICDLFDTLKRNKTLSWTIDDYLKHVHAHSFYGDAEGDMTANPGSWSENNISLVTEAFISALNQTAHFNGQV